MDLNAILESKPLKVLVLIVGLISGVGKILDFLLPSAVQPILTVCLLISIIYLSLLGFKWIGDHFVAGMSRRIASILQGNVILTEAANLTTESNVSSLAHAEQAYKYFAERYGIGYSALHIQWAIRHDGSARLTRTAEVEAYSVISQLDTYLAIREESPSGEKRSIRFREIESLSRGKEVILNELIEEHQKLSGLITISPPLTRGESVKYRMVEQLPTGLYAISISEREWKKRETDYDYSGWNINRPTKKLILQVYFPENYRPRVYSAKVRYASASGFPSNREQHEEQEHLQAPVMEDHGIFSMLTLEIDYPMIGLIYMLRWQPILDKS